MGLPGFEPGSQAPKARIVTKLDYSPLQSEKKEAFKFF